MGTIGPAEKLPSKLAFNTERNNDGDVDVVDRATWLIALITVNWQLPRCASSRDPDSLAQRSRRFCRRGKSLFGAEKVPASLWHTLQTFSLLFFPLYFFFFVIAYEKRYTETFRSFSLRWRFDLLYEYFVVIIFTWEMREREREIERCIFNADTKENASRGDKDKAVVRKKQMPRQVTLYNKKQK